MMVFEEKLGSPGEYLMTLPGKVGDLEAVLSIPEAMDRRYIALLGHPHSLQGGTMSNKVVTTLARTFKELRIASLRFNFRGVGQSGGVYDAGIGESEDMLLLANYWKAEFPDANVLFAGFSFGSYVAYRAAAHHEHGLLVTVAPPVHHYDYKEFYPPPMPWIVVQGDEDEVVPLGCILDFMVEAPSGILLRRLPNAGHFFHGKLLELKSVLLSAITDTGLIL